ncbi:MAG: SDR family oxidoreductase [Chloroflexota bacterium]|nr:SDR family oxidoreductase [Chloroflexota bacterium]
MRLAGKVAVVTGASNGIGKRTARRFAAEGARVVVSDVQDEAGQAVVERIRGEGGDATYVHADILLEDELRQLVASATQAYGRLDVLVNNAMVSGARTAVEATAEEFDRAMAGIPRASFLACKHAIPEMIKGGSGSIICIASVHGLLPARRSLGYEVGKSALANLCRQISVDYGPQGIRANVICPGGVQSRLEDDDPTPDTPQRRFTREIYPSRRLGWPRDIANACLFFASDEASWVTGQVLAVDGGLTSQLQDDLGFRLAAYLQEHPDALEGWERR